MKTKISKILGRWIGVEAVLLSLSFFVVSCARSETDKFIGPAWRPRPEPRVPSPINIGPNPTDLAYGQGGGRFDRAFVYKDRLLIYPSDKSCRLWFYFALDDVTAQRRLTQDQADRIHQRDQLRESRGHRLLVQLRRRRRGLGPGIELESVKRESQILAKSDELCREVGEGAALSFDLRLVSAFATDRTVLNRSAWVNSNLDGYGSDSARLTLAPETSSLEPISLAYIGKDRFELTEPRRAIVRRLMDLLQDQAVPNCSLVGAGGVDHVREILNEEQYFRPVFQAVAESILFRRRTLSGMDCEGSLVELDTILDDLLPIPESPLAPLMEPAGVSFRRSGKPVVCHLKGCGRAELSTYERALKVSLLATAMRQRFKVNLGRLVLSGQAGRRPDRVVIPLERFDGDGPGRSPLSMRIFQVIAEIDYQKLILIHETFQPETARGEE